MTVKYVDTLHKPFGLKCSALFFFTYIFAGIPMSLWWGSFGIFSLLDGSYPSIIYNPYNKGRFILSTYFRHPSDLFILIFTPVLLFTLLWLPLWVYKARKNIKNITHHFKKMEFSTPLPSNTIKSSMGYEFFSIDIKRGTMLYICHLETSFFSFFFPKDVRVMGFGMYDWQSIEVAGNTLRIYTGRPELPSIEISTGKAQQLFQKINAMKSKGWAYEYNMPGYVEYQAKRIAEKQGINLILPVK